MEGRRKLRIGSRMEARLTHRDAATMDPTPDDLANLDAFAQTLVDATGILREEIDNINAGHLDVVGELFERKTRLLKWIELKMPVVEPFLTHEEAAQRGIPDLLGHLRLAADQNGELLSRMSTAARSIIREIEKSVDRNGLGGLYGKSGQKLQDGNTTEMRIDQEF